MLVVIDYEAGNMHNVSAALKSLGAEFSCSGDPKVVEMADRLILPGVGSARPAMDALRRRAMVETLKAAKVPLLGICLGMQLLHEFSEEDDVACLGVLPGGVRRFDKSLGKVPHVGWNQVRQSADEALWRGIPDQSHFYFVHGYYAPRSPQTSAETDYTVTFASGVGSGNFRGVQFHPELSGENGLRLLRNFLESD